MIQIDGLRVGDHVLMTAIGIDGADQQHVLAITVGATKNAAVVDALLADLIERGFQPDIARLFIVDGAKALSQAIRDTFSNFALIQRCQVHKEHDIVERLDLVAACRNQEDTAPSFGPSDRRAGRARSPDSGATARSRCPWRLGFDPRKAERDAHRDPHRSA